jgi:hypothetical protein
VPGESPVAAHLETLGGPWQAEASGSWPKWLERLFEVMRRCLDGGYPRRVPLSRQQLRWLVPTFAGLAVAGLIIVVLAIAAQAWLVVAAGALAVLGNGLGLWNKLIIRRQVEAAALRSAVPPCP